MYYWFLINPSSLQYFAQNTNANVAAAILKFSDSYSNTMKFVIQCIADNWWDLHNPCNFQLRGLTAFHT